MFSQPIVFVVGAGASDEFGLPVGSQLVASIALALNFNRDASGNLLGHQAFFDLLGSKYGQDAGQYHRAATELATKVTEFDSIDEALHWFSARPDIVSLGKASIVREILAAERRSDIFNALNAANDANTWLPSFLSVVIGSQTREQAVKAAFQNVTIINFNYDRTIEHFLLARLQSKFGLNTDEAEGAISTLKIIRPYGSVGPLPWQDTDGVSFGAELGGDHQKLFALADNVRTYTEQNVTATIRSDVQSAITAARIIVFLGFGYHQTNMILLRATSAVSWRRVIATALAIDDQNFETLRLAIATTVGCSDTKNVKVLPWHSHQIFQRLKPSLLATL